MPGLQSNLGRNWVTPAAIVAAVVFLYLSVINKLGYDWWTDENYSHGLLVPFVIGVIVWLEREKLAAVADGGSRILGSAAVASAFVLLLAGTLGSELFTQRISLLVMAAAIVAANREVLSASFTYHAYDLIDTSSDGSRSINAAARRRAPSGLPRTITLGADVHANAS